MVLMKRHLHRLGAAAVSGALLASLLTACGGGITAETPSVVPESPAQQTEQAVAETDMYPEFWTHKKLN